jgi:hypothetical protein
MIKDFYKMSHQFKYIICVATVVAAELVVALSWPKLITEGIALFMFGAALYIYFCLARLFSTGEAFNIFLLGTVFSIYVGTLLIPLYFMFRRYRWPLLVAQALLVILHFLESVALKPVYN